MLVTIPHFCKCDDHDNVLSILKFQERKCLFDEQMLIQK